MGAWKTGRQRNVDSRLSVHEMSEGKKDCIRNQDRDHLCAPLPKNLALFCQCPDDSSESELKDNVVIY